MRSMLTRISLRVGRPTAAVMRRTWRFRPSLRDSSTQLVGIDARNRIGGSRSGSSDVIDSGNRLARAGRVGLPLIGTPDSS